MKKLALITAAAVMTLTGTLATAQPYGNAYGYHRKHDRDARESRYRDSDRDGRSDASEWNRDRDRDGRPDQYDRYDGRRDGGSYRYGASSGYDRSPYGYRSYRQGERYPYYNQRSYIIEDYRSYNLPRPRSGYRYYRSDNGDIVMVAIASGIIGMVIGGALANNNNHYGDYRR
jgi:Ni/Co efflux regulator RcnB